MSINARRFEPAPGAKGGAMTPFTLAVRRDAGERTLRVLSFRGREAASRPFRFDVRVAAEAVDAAELEGLLGEHAVLTIGSAPEPRTVAGVVAAVEGLGALHDGQRAFRVQLVPPSQPGDVLPSSRRATPVPRTPRSSRSPARGEQPTRDVAVGDELRACVERLGDEHASRRRRVHVAGVGVAATVALAGVCAVLMGRLPHAPQDAPLPVPLRVGVEPQPLASAPDSLLPSGAPSASVGPSASVALAALPEASAPRPSAPPARAWLAQRAAAAPERAAPIAPSASVAPPVAPPPSASPGHRMFGVDP